MSIPLFYYQQHPPGNGTVQNILRSLARHSEAIPLFVWERDVYHQAKNIYSWLTKHHIYLSDEWLKPLCIPLLDELDHDNFIPHLLGLRPSSELINVLWGEHVYPKIVELREIDAENEDIRPQAGILLLKSVIALGLPFSRFMDTVDETEKFSVLEWFSHLSGANPSLALRFLQYYREQTLNEMSHVRSFFHDGTWETLQWVSLRDLGDHFTIDQWEQEWDTSFLQFIATYDCSQHAFWRLNENPDAVKHMIQYITTHAEECAAIPGDFSTLQFLLSEIKEPDVLPFRKLLLMHPILREAAFENGLLIDRFKIDPEVVWSHYISRMDRTTNMHRFPNHPEVYRHAVSFFASNVHHPKAASFLEYHLRSYHTNSSARDGPHSLFPWGADFSDKERMYLWAGVYAAQQMGMFGSSSDCNPLWSIAYFLARDKTMIKTQYDLGLTEPDVAAIIHHDYDVIRMDHLYTLSGIDTNRIDDSGNQEDMFAKFIRLAQETYCGNTLQSLELTV